MSVRPRISSLASVVGLALVALPSLAYAEDPAITAPSATPIVAPVPAPVPVEPDPLRDPGFATIDRASGTSLVGIEGSFVAVGGGTTVLRGDLHAQYVHPSGLGVYATVPMIYESDSSETTSSIGNVELGGLYAARVSPSWGLVARVGVVVPSAPTLENGALLYPMAGRLDDLALGVTDTWVVRAGVSALFRSGQIFGRLDVGVDDLLANDGLDSLSEEPMIRLNAAIGYDAGLASFSAEVTNLLLIGPGYAPLDTGALTARLAGPVQPYVAFVVPLDDNVRLIMNSAITVGVDIPLR